MPLDQVFLYDFIQVITDTTGNDITVDDLHIDIADALNSAESDLGKIVRALKKHFEEKNDEDYTDGIRDILTDDSIETLYQLAERIHDVIELG